MKPNATAARRFLLMGLVLLPVGIAFAATGNSGVGGIAMLGALGLLVVGLHTFGRAGPDSGA